MYTVGKQRKKGTEEVKHITPGFVTFIKCHEQLNKYLHL